MDIRHKLYPYPVLSEMTDDYVDSYFRFEDVKAERGIREIILKIKLNLSNIEIQRLIDEEKAEYVVHIECSSTCYRKIVRSSEADIKKSIPENELNGRVSVCAFIVAKSEINAYSNSNFNEDYESITFDMHRGNMLAIGGQIDVDVTKEVEEMTKIPSIFTICRCAEDTDDSMKIDVYGEKIAITLSNLSFQNYKVLANMPSMLPVFHSMIIIPALIYALDTLKKDGIEPFEELRWLKSIRRSLKQYECELSADILDTIPSYELAQKLIDCPIDKALSAIVSYDTTEEEM